MSAHTPPVEPPCVRTPLLETIRTDLRVQRGNLDPVNLCIRGVSTTRYRLKLLPESTPFDLQFVSVQTDQIGCCYYPVPELITGEDACIGASVFDRFEHPALDIAALDAAAAAIAPRGEHRVLSGTSSAKASQRAHLICSEARRLAGSAMPPRVALVGVVGEVLHELRGWDEIEVLASDYAPQLAGDQMEGVAVKSGADTGRLIESADVAIVTGMTLANGTLQGILDAAQRAKTKLLIFAQTGHSFAPTYLRLGVDTVVSERFPFYLSAAGPSDVWVARRAKLQS
jgi:hypothetical protein